MLSALTYGEVPFGEYKRVESANCFGAFLTKMKTVIKSFSSTPEGQRQMFWDSHAVVAQFNQDKMARISFDAGLKDKQNNSPPRLPNIVDYMDGYNSIA